MRNIQPCPTCGKDVALSAHACPHCGERLKSRWVVWLSGAVLLLLIVALLSARNGDGDKPADSGTTGPSASSRPSSPVEYFDNATPEAIEPTGELAAMFRLGSDYTDLQRENRENSLKGRVVQWRLPVFEVRRSGGNFRVQTGGNADYVGVFATVHARNEQEVAFIERVKTGDWVTLKGKIAGTSVRHIELEPAVLVFEQPAVAPAPVVPPPAVQPSGQATQEEAVQAAVDREGRQAVPPTPKPAVSVWIADWGNGILGVVADKPCEDAELLAQGYGFKAASTIPLERLKKPADAWFVDTESQRAVTVAGCWLKKEDGLIHLKMRRKKDGRIFEEDRNLGDGSWTAVE